MKFMILALASALTLSSAVALAQVAAVEVAVEVEVAEDQAPVPMADRQAPLLKHPFERQHDQRHRARIEMPRMRQAAVTRARLAGLDDPLLHAGEHVLNLESRARLWRFGLTPRYVQRNVGDKVCRRAGADRRPAHKALPEFRRWSRAP